MLKNLKIAATLAIMLAAPLTLAQQASMELNERIVSVTTEFLDTLTRTQHNNAVYDFDDEERLNWTRWNLRIGTAGRLGTQYATVGDGRGAQQKEKHCVDLCATYYSCAHVKTSFDFGISVDALGRRRSLLHHSAGVTNRDQSLH